MVSYILDKISVTFSLVNVNDTMKFNLNNEIRLKEVVNTKYNWLPGRPSGPPQTICIPDIG